MGAPAKKATGGGEKKAPAKKRKPRRKAAEPGSIGLAAADVPLERAAGGPLAALEADLERDGAGVVGRYREPFGGNGVVLAALPIAMVEPTPYQRDASKPHVERLAGVVSKIGRYLDPIVAIRAGEKKYLTPNGNHRLQAMKMIGAKSIVALVVPEREVAFQILALNTEKAHNLREKSLEVIRMYRALAKEDPRPEADHALSFDEPWLATLGLCYEERPRFSGGAYQSVLKRVDAFLDEPLPKAYPHREKRAALVLELDDEIGRIVEALKKRGLKSPYLKAFAMARINYLRFVKGEMPPFEKALASLVEKAKKFDPEKIRQQDLAGAGGPPDEEG